MARPISDIAFTLAVKAAQEERGARTAYAKMEQRGGWNSTVTPGLAEFIAERESLYLATASAGGQPYKKSSQVTKLDTGIGLVSQASIMIMECHPQSSRLDHFYIVSSVSHRQYIGGC